MSESQWNYLGLSHNPFSDPQKEFFPGADRELLLGKVRRLSEWSRPVVAVTGPHGVGKTCLFRALSSSLEAGVVAARVNGSLVSRAGDVLSALVQGYGVAAPSGADAPLLIELIIAHLKDQSQNDRKSLVLVDDAHLLEQRAVDDLVSLAAAGAHLAFFSEPQFVESLQRAVERNAETKVETGAESLLWHEMLLSPFSREQTSEYLEWRFDEAGYNGRMPFSEYQADGIYRASEGFPGRLDFAANEQLMVMTVGGARTAGIPRKHLLLAATLACVLGLVFWFWSPGSDDDANSKMVTLELPQLGEQDNLRSTRQRGEPVVTEAPNRGRANQSGSAAGLIASTTNDTADNSAVTPIASGQTQTQTQSEDTAGSVPSSTVTLSRTVQPVDPKPVVAVPSESRTVRVDVPAESKPQPTKPVVVAQPTPRSQPQKVPKPAPSVASKPAETGSAASSSTGGGAFANAANSPRNASWLLAQSDASYTIQLIGFSDADRAKNYLAQQDQAGRFALFRTRSGERVVHVVTYGVYDSQAAAEVAVTRLPASVGKVSPWVRPIRNVKGAIKTALQSDG